MTIEVVGDITLTNEYWDCECAEGFIRPRSQDQCAKCAAVREDQPDSRLNEVLAAGLIVRES